VTSPRFPDPTTTFRRRTAVPPPSPLVVSVPHAGVATTGFEDALAPTLDVRADADLLVDALYGIDAPSAADPGPSPSILVDAAAGLRPAVYVAAALSRFVCDMNRHPDDVSAAAVPQHPAPRNADGRGFVWAVTTTGAPALAHPLSLAEWQARADAHAAYHGAIAEALTRARDRFGFAVLLDGHSMPSVGRSGHTDRGRARAEIVPGDREGTSCHPSLSALVKSHFTSSGFSVAFNDPYKGGFITAHHGRPADGIHAIQVEVRRDLYMDEVAFAPRPAGFARLGEALRELVKSLASWQPA
jgi:N-formylglutamate deformylase